ncbi:MAG: alpha-hydroxy-acid oxidizing protein [Eubacteriales bacterium]|nr:alpha-hydroxy-acid oxidizing protein [Eubacteriales bacterium]
MSEEIKSPWPGPKGLIPVTSGKAEDANVFNRNYLDSIHVEMRVIDAVLPDLTTQIFGETFASPIMMPAFSHLNKVGKGQIRPMVEYAKAAKELQVLNWVGMEPNDEFLEILQAGAKTVRIIKPFADKAIILDQIAFAEENGAFAVGIDIDHVVGDDGRYDRVDGYPMGPVMQTDLEKFVSASKLPFIAKGVLSVQDARKAQAAGCAGIVVSHHHGRIPFGMPPAAMLGRIKEAVGDDMVVFCDCGIDDGYDAYKALALGADAVSVGRGILAPLLKENCDGVVRKVQRMNEQLSQLMMYTAVKDTNSFDRTVLSAVSM